MPDLQSEQVRTHASLLAPFELAQRVNQMQPRRTSLPRGAKETVVYDFVGPSLRPEKRCAPPAPAVFGSIAKIMAVQPKIEEPEIAFIEDRGPSSVDDSGVSSMSFGGADLCSYGTFDAWGNFVRNNTEEIYWAMAKELTPRSKKGHRLRPFQSGEYWTLVSCMSSDIPLTFVGSSYSRACPCRVIMYWAQGAMLTARGWVLPGMDVVSFGWYMIIGLEAEVASVCIHSVAYLDRYTGPNQVFSNSECAAFCGVLTVDDDGSPVSYERPTTGPSKLAAYMPADVRDDFTRLPCEIFPRGSLQWRTEAFEGYAYGSFGHHPVVGDVRFGKCAITGLAFGYRSTEVDGIFVFTGNRRSSDGRYEACLQHDPGSDYVSTHFTQVRSIYVCARVESVCRGGMVVPSETPMGPSTGTKACRGG